LGNEHPNGNPRSGKSGGRILQSHGEILGSVLGTRTIWNARRSRGFVLLSE
jgi:hypothetical protein